MADVMTFPKTMKEFVDNYSFKDSDEVYTNGSMLIQTFRIEQAIEHYGQEICKKLAEYEQAEEDGLLIKLPFSVGDTVYCVDKLRKFVDECEVITIKCLSREKGYIGINVETMGSLWHCVRLELVGKEVFLTKAEAEQALAKMKGE